MKRINLSIVAVIATGLLIVGSNNAISAPFDDDLGTDRVERMQTRLKVIERYLSIVESIHSISDNSEKTVLYQLQQLEDIYKKQRDPGKIVSLYEDVLKNTSNQTIRNAVTMKLTQIYKRLGRDNAAEELARNSLDENLKLLKK